MGDLRHDFDQAYVRSKIKERAEEINGAADPQYFSIDHPRTKEAEQFVSHVQARRR